ncbi:MAG TPA: hypothetical protein VEH52_06735 [Gaiellaceae bacterium]|nr:hypothetical protein [Gaiellaceae bacterium]
MLGGLVGWSALAGHRLAWVVAAVGCAGWAIVAAALAGRWSSIVAIGLAIVGAEYATYLSLRGGSVDSRAPFAAAVLIAASELAFLAIAPPAGRIERTLLLRFGLVLVAIVLGTLLVGELVLVAAGSVRSSLALEAVGVLAAVAATALLLRTAVSR